MSTVQLSDIIDVTVFQDLPGVDGVEKTAFFESGVINSSPLLGSLANAAGKTAELPFWNDLDESSAPNISTDDPTDIATPVKITQGEQISRKAFLNKGWSESDLASELVLGPKALSALMAPHSSTTMKRREENTFSPVSPTEPSTSLRLI